MGKVEKGVGVVKRSAARRSVEALVDDQFLADEGPQDFGFFGVRLSLKQAKFVEYYVLHGNGAKAVRDAGYYDNGRGTALRRLLDNPRIQECLLHFRLSRERKFGITNEAVIDLIMETWNGAIFDKQFSAAARCLELLSKIQGMMDDPASRRNPRSRYLEVGDADLASEAAPILRKLGLDVGEAEVAGVMRERVGGED